MASTETSPVLRRPDRTEMACAVCLNVPRSLLICTRCRSIYYCSQKCVEADNAIHNILCKEFAETPRPQHIRTKDFRRIFFFDPIRDRPEIRWVQSKLAWVVDELRSVRDRPTLPPWDREAMIIQYSTSPLPNRPYRHHTQVMTRYSAGVDGSIHNRAVSGGMEAAGLTFPGHVAKNIPTPVDSWRGPIIAARHEGKSQWAEFLIRGGPEQQDVTMADFRHLMMWFWTAYHRTSGPSFEQMRQLARGGLGATGATGAIWDVDNSLAFLARSRLCPAFQELIRPIGPWQTSDWNDWHRRLCKKAWMDLRTEEKRKHHDCPLPRELWCSKVLGERRSAMEEMIPGTGIMMGMPSDTRTPFFRGHRRAQSG